ncbi:RNA dependent RNA polymerase-domain-containing protein [Limtongia smithiae]|uniref:RNA dependent RNA polymerase-domain-containing protein n=1 Tax=Limtongia smithiae TaxID=1125753 RepID=UPI0034CF0642
MYRSRKSSPHTAKLSNLAVFHEVYPITLSVPRGASAPALLRFGSRGGPSQIPDEHLIYDDTTNRVITASGQVVDLFCLHAKHSPVVRNRGMASDNISSYQAHTECKVIQATGSSRQITIPLSPANAVKQSATVDRVSELSGHDRSSGTSSEGKATFAEKSSTGTGSKGVEDLRYFWDPGREAYVLFGLPVKTEVDESRSGLKMNQIVKRTAVMIRGSDWQHWPELMVRIRGVPIEWTIYNLYETIVTTLKLGSIWQIDMPEPSKRRRDFTIVTFRPTPNTDFWSVRRPFYSNYHVSLTAELLMPNRSLSIASPLDPTMFCIYLQQYPVQSLDIGYLTDPDTFNVKYQTHLEAKNLLEINLEQRTLKIFFQTAAVQEETNHLIDLDGTNQRRKITLRLQTYAFKIQFDQIKEVRFSKGPRRANGESSRRFAFNIEGAPQFFKRRNIVKRLTETWGSLHFNEKDCWLRVTDIPMSSIESLSDEKPLHTYGRPGSIDGAHWTTYALNFMLRDQEIDMLDYLFKFLTTCGLDYTRAPYRNVEQEDHDFVAYLNDISLPFSVQYQLEVCISNNWLHVATISSEFLVKLSQLPTEEATGLLEKIADDQKRVWDPMSIFMTFQKSSIADEFPNYCSPMRKAQITPMSIVLSTPMVDITNRVIRQHIHLADRFIRVQFTDEKARGKLGYGDYSNNEMLYKRVEHALKYGIDIGGRHYDYLASGNSQIREHGAWFYATDGSVTVEDIRAWMGTFSNIKSIAKNMARVGQCFSTTRALRTTKPLVKYIPDIERNGFCFTDGVGKMSPAVAQIIASEILQTPTSPSAVQFRLGGCKGILATWPDVKGFQIEIRKSQEKFISSHTTLEIVRCSSFTSSRLNRQLIAVLSSLGVDDEVFLARQNRMLGYLQRLTTEKEAAIYLLAKSGDENGSNKILADILLSDFMGQDTFVDNLLRLYQAYSLKMLKHKARIWIEKGALLLGVCDESGMLRGHTLTQREERERTWDQMQRLDVSSLPEVFLQITDPRDASGRTKTIITGLCVLARNPALHPGDIRVVNAVDKEKLRHLVDVIVLPVTGTRDVANMASGGDLDGDDYSVIWDRQLIPRVVNYRPMDYTPPAPQVKAGDEVVSVDDRRKFMIDYMKKDKLGVIALSHLAFQDSSRDGVMDAKCLQLAKLHSMAVDFAKTGIAPRLPPSLRCRDYPHYMERKHGNTYHSTKVLGRLYDSVQELVFKEKQTDTFDARLLEGEHCVDDKELWTMTRRLKHEYDNKVHRMMLQRGIETELEVFTGYVMKYEAGGHNNDYKYWEEVSQQFAAIADMTRNKVYEETGFRDRTKPAEERERRLCEFVAMAYRVGKEEIQEMEESKRQVRERIEQQKASEELALADTDLLHMIDSDKPPKQTVKSPEDEDADEEAGGYAVFLSFPWLFYQTLCTMARKASCGRREDAAAASAVAAGAGGEQEETRKELKAATAAAATVVPTSLENSMLEMSAAARRNRNKMRTSHMMKLAATLEEPRFAAAPMRAPGGGNPRSRISGPAMGGVLGMNGVATYMNLPAELTEEDIAAQLS